MRRLHVFLAAAALALPMTVAAHGDADHAATKPAKPPAAAAEQKPFGREGDPRKVARTIRVSMSDAMRYDPAEIHVKRGETLRLEVANHGKVLHEIVIGTMDELKAHAEMMRKFPGMEHDEPHMAHVKAGGKGSVVWEFNRAGVFHYACLIPGHFEAGMVGKVVVSP
jgi:uncharacterized cupredoxin-like copper-binding protein